VQHSANCSRNSRDGAPHDRAAATRHLAIVGKRLGQAHANASFRRNAGKLRVNTPSSNNREGRASTRRECGMLHVLIEIQIAH
jgi:hypothetical protein